MEQSQAWAPLCQFITTLNHFEKLFNSEYKFDLYRYWRASQKEGSMI
jgi:hypothetical protein